MNGGEEGGGEGRGGGGEGGRGDETHRAGVEVSAGSHLDRHPQQQILSSLEQRLVSSVHFEVVGGAVRGFLESRYTI